MAASGEVYEGGRSGGDIGGFQRLLLEYDSSGELSRTLNTQRSERRRCPAQTGDLAGILLSREEARLVREGGGGE